MSYLFEIYYKAPPDEQKEAILSEHVSKYGGHLDFREEPGENDAPTVVLTYEFDDFDQAEAAAELLRQRGEHVEGPGEYGP